LKIIGRKRRNKHMEIRDSDPGDVEKTRRAIRRRLPAEAKGLEHRPDKGSRDLVSHVQGTGVAHVERVASLYDCTQ